MLGKNFFSFLKDYTFKSDILKKKSLFQAYPGIKTKNGKFVPVSVTFSEFNDSSGKKLKILSATDATLEILNQNLSMRAIIDTQEMERQRIAKDLHDTIIQQLSAIKFEIGSTLNLVENKTIHADLQKSNKLLSSVIEEVRTICFNIMPPQLREYGLIKAIGEFSLIFNSHTNFKIVEDLRLPPFSKQLKIDLYRILQEMISNSVKHGKATLITIRFFQEKNSLEFHSATTEKALIPGNLKEVWGCKTSIPG